MRSRIKNSLLSLLALFLVAIAFQNMSPLTVSSPEAKYFPKNISSTTAEGVGGEILKHNLAPLGEVLKNRFEVMTENHRIRLGTSDNDLSAEYASGTDDISSSWIVGVTSASSARLAFKGAVDLTCDVSADQSYKISVKRSLSSTSDLRLVHDSKARDSSVKMQISW